jgi:glycosyltransferase involved in cell wall biosynthesis
LELLADEAAANQLGQLGRQRVIANFSIETMVNRTLDLYRSVAQSSALSTQHST